MPEFPERLRRALAERYDSVSALTGGTGAASVYLAHDRKLDRQVVLKVLLPELCLAVETGRFLREVAIAARLTHPRIVTVYDSGDVDGCLYYIMPYVAGESLRDALSRRGRLPLTEAVHFACHVAGALTYAHKHGVIHRDIKPDNILLTAGEAVVTDFGVARAISAADTGKVTSTGMTVGTPAYLSPEQCRGRKKLDGRSDQYALGCVVYEMLAGHPPFTGASPQEVLARHVRDAVPTLRAARPEIPQGVEQVVTTALAKKPGDRFDTVAEFAGALSSAAVEGGPGPSPQREAGAWARLGAWLRRRTSI